VNISIVVSTRDRADRLVDAFPHYSRLKSALAWEAVFVNNGSTDHTASVLARFAASLPLKVKVIDEPKPGVSAGRNAGWHRATGAVIAFMDDDCYPAEDYLDRLWECFAEPELGYLGGRILLYDKKDYPITIRTELEREDIPPRSFLRAGVVHGANMAFRREVLQQIGDFDERLGPGAVVYGEELDLLARASAEGFRGAYDPRPVVFHHHRRSSREDVRRLMAIYDLGRGAYYARAVTDPRMCRAFLWPVIRRILGNLRRLDFGVMWREFHGAWKYLTLPAQGRMRRAPHDC
jgi:GT2 family glycosyltransferase